MPEPFVGITDDGENPVEVDDKSSALNVIDVVHHEVHEGESYHAALRGDNIGSGTNADILFVVPAGVYAHMTARFTSTSEAEAFFYLSPTTSAAGSALTPRNRNFASALTSGVTVTTAPTVTSVGTLVESERFGSKEAKLGGDRASGGEWVLDEGTYLFRITSRAEGNYCKIALDWYEH